MLRAALRQSARLRPLPRPLSGAWAGSACCAAVLGVLAPTAAAEAAEDFEEAPPEFDKDHYPDGINSNFVNDRPTEDVVRDFTKRFEDPESRDIARAWPALVELLKGSFSLEGKTIADIGAGTGLFTKPFVEAVGPSGSVVSVELSEHFVQHLGDMKAAAAPALDNVEVVQCTDKSANLPENSVDVAFICDVYHHLAFPRTFMRSLRRALRPGGFCVVIDFHRIPEKMTSHKPEWVLVHVRAGQEVFREEVVDAGFELVTEPELPELEENYIMVFTKPESEPAPASTKPAPESSTPAGVDLSQFSTEALLQELESRLK